MRIALTLDRDASRSSEENDYIAALERAGLAREEIVLLPPGTSPDGEFDGVVIGGGVDVDPERYGRPVRSDAGVEVDSERDTTDFAMFEKARGEQAPILGICRGLQVVNVALGGTLVQDLATERPSEVRHQRPDRVKRRREHPVTVAPGTKLAQIAGEGEIAVNSRHHQAVERLGSGLVVSAVSPDGVVEGLELPGTPWLVAVQWHPENLVGDPPSERLFQEFVRVVRERVEAKKARAGYSRK